MGKKKNNAEFDKRKPVDRSDVFYRLHHNHSVLNDLCIEFGLSITEINDWRTEFLNKADSLFVEYKKRIIDAYNLWTNNKLKAIHTTSSARTCIEQILKAQIINDLKITEFSFKDFNRFQDAGIFWRKNENKWALTVCQDVVEHFVLFTKKTTNDLDNIRLSGNISAHEGTEAFRSEVETMDYKLMDLLNEFFIKCGETDWKKKYIDSQTKSMYHEFIKGLNAETKEVERNEILEKIEEAKNKYFKYLEIECGEVHFEGLPIDMNSGGVRVKLENIFIPLYLTETEKNNETSDKEIGEILNETTRLAILGKPGAGKSTLIKSIAIAYAFPDRRKQISSSLPDRQWFPIFIRCRDLKEKAVLPVTEIINYIPMWALTPNYSEPFSRLVWDKLKEGNGLLLIDGLDEITEDRNRKLFVTHLQTFLKTFPNTHIIITSREAGFRIVADSFANYCAQYKISPLNNNAIETLSLKWHKAVVNDSKKTAEEAKKIANLIRYNSNLKTLGKTPLLLTALFFVKRRTGNLPTQKHILYQKMIELLLQTWNVEGHEQLEIEDSEVQLGYVAYWMTKNRQLTIHEEDLKKCLYEARKQMPEILGYSKISVVDFIKRVELRSSLLIMAGHTILESGTITPIYEFSHLSFQEYLASIAIVNNFLPKEDSEKTPLEILIPNIANNSWREIQLITAVLLKRECKDLVEYLVSESKKITNEERKVFHYLRSSKKRRISGEELKKEIQKTLQSKISEEEFDIIEKKFLLVELLGQYIAHEIQINSETLDKASEWFSKNYFPNVKEFYEDLIPMILKSKFGEIFKKNVKSHFFNHFEDEFALTLISVLRYIAHDDGITERKDLDTFFASIKRDILNDDKKIKCMGILRLGINFAFPIPEFLDSIHDRGNLTDGQIIQKIKNGSKEIFEELLTSVSFEDPHYYSTIGWSLTALTQNFGYEIAPPEYIKIFLNGWINATQNNLHLISSQVLSTVLSPYEKMNFLKEHNLRDVILKKYRQPQNEVDRLVAIYLGILVGIKWNIEEIKIVFINSKYSSTLNSFSNSMRIGNVNYQGGYGPI